MTTNADMSFIISASTLSAGNDDIRATFQWRFVPVLWVPITLKRFGRQSVPCAERQVCPEFRCRYTRKQLLLVIHCRYRKLYLSVRSWVKPVKVTVKGFMECHGFLSYTHTHIYRHIYICVCVFLTFDSSDVNFVVLYLSCSFLIHGGLRVQGNLHIQWTFIQ